MVLIKSDLIGLTISGAWIMSEIRWYPAGTKAPQTELLSLLETRNDQKQAIVWQ